MERKYAELQNQMEGLKLALSKIEVGMEMNKPSILKRELHYMEEKFNRIKEELIIINNNEK